MGVNPQWVDLKLGCQWKSHQERANYDKQPSCPLWPLVSQFHLYLPWINTHLAYCLNNVLNIKSLVSTFNFAESSRSCVLGSKSQWVSHGPSAAHTATLSRDNCHHSQSNGLQLITQEFWQKKQTWERLYLSKRLKVLSTQKSLKVKPEEEPKPGGLNTDTTISAWEILETRKFQWKFL